jgi:hypothetical protein
MSNEDELRLCRFLLQKYSDIINEREQRTIGEIKELVNGNDMTIQSIIDDVKPQNYSFEQEYENTLEKFFKFITDEINFVDPELSLNYWMSPREVMEVKVADDEDLAVFLCAGMKALGDEKAEVIISEMENLKTHAFVITELNENFLILDPSQKHEFSKYIGDKTEMIKKYSFAGNKIKRFLYRFNSNKYEQFLE